MAEDKPISRYAQRFVERKLEQLMRQAEKGTGLYYELYAQNFTDSVDRLASQVKRDDLREHILSRAEQTGHYFGRDAQQGRWDYDAEAGDLRWNGEPLDWMKRVDFSGQWVSKSAEERARYVVGQFGDDRGTQNDYPGVQVEKNGVRGPVQWGPEQSTAQDAQQRAEKMLDEHLGFAAPKLAPSSHDDIRKSDEMSGRLGAKVLTRAYRKYIKESASQRTSAAQKYGANETVDRETTPPKKSL
jgi:hypothetical protein